MDIRAFTKPNGTFVRNSKAQVTFVPKKLPLKIELDSETYVAISQANLKLGELVGIARLLPNPHVLINPYMRREAVLSSRIEGTQASLSELFLYEATGDQSIDSVFKRVREVRNYVAALQGGFREIAKRRKRINLELIKKMHRMLLQGVRGQERRPGEFRTVQNWISAEGQKIDDAVYVPPAPEVLLDALKNLEKFIQGPPEGMPSLVHCAVLHYQFEAIHPFLDGNGRIGRLLIPLFLCEQKIMPQPLLYPSAYFEKNKSEYYERLLAVSQKSDWNGWIKFFMTAVYNQSDDATQNIQKLIELQKKYDIVLRKNKATHNAFLLKENLFSNPYTTITNTAEYLGVSFVTAQNTIKILQKHGILRLLSEKKRNRVFVAPEIIGILR
jgi:Fic family protein